MTKNEKSFTIKNDNNNNMWWIVSIVVVDVIANWHTISETIEK